MPDTLDDPETPLPQCTATRALDGARCTLPEGHVIPHAVWVQQLGRYEDFAGHTREPVDG